MFKTNIVRYEFVKIDNKYYDIINNFRYDVMEKGITIKKISKKDFRKYPLQLSLNPALDTSLEIYLDQFVEFYNELLEIENNKIEKLDFLSIRDGQNINLDYIKIEVESLVIADKVTIEPFEKHFNHIELIFGWSRERVYLEVSEIKSTFISNAKKIRNHNYNELYFTHYFGNHKSYYIYCELDYLLCKFRDEMNFKNVKIYNVNSGIEFSEEDFVNENVKWNSGFNIFFRND